DRPQREFREPRERRQRDDRDDRSRPPRGERPERAPRPERGPKPDMPEMETFRIAVGHAHRVEPRNIVGAIANEAGLDSAYIGRIDIREDHSFVDLPAGMPKDIFKSLKKVWVGGQQLQIQLASDPTPFAEAEAPRKPRFGGPRDADGDDQGRPARKGPPKKFGSGPRPGGKGPGSKGPGGKGGFKSGPKKGFKADGPKSSKPGPKRDRPAADGDGKPARKPQRKPRF
ncbi:MAG: DbpA RNA binding domain-containing protein, partial [Oceanococcaceae bacterium]